MPLIKVVTRSPSTTGAVVNFTTYPTVTLNGNNGDDTINVNPTTLVGVTTAFNVIGGDPTASDELIVNGTAGTDTINYTTSDTVGSGSVAITGAPTVAFTTVEALTIDGQGGTDTLAITTPVGGHIETYTPGAAPDSGTIAIRSISGGTAAVRFDFRPYRSLAGVVTFAGAGSVGPICWSLSGTSNSDTFNVNGLGAQIRNPANGFVTDLLSFPGISQLTLRGLDGDDTFNIAGTLLPLAGGLIVDGGNPSATAVVILSGAIVPVAVNFGVSSAL